MSAAVHPEPWLCDRYGAGLGRKAHPRENVRKKREHGRHSYDFDQEARFMFRDRSKRPVYGVQAAMAAMSGERTPSIPD
jgi:hypothetical protein